MVDSCRDDYNEGQHCTVQLNVHFKSIHIKCPITHEHHFKIP